MKEQEVHWERLERKTLVDHPFLKVYSDKVLLPNGDLIPDYTVVKKPDSVVVVATTIEDELVAIRCYEYAVDKTLLHLPAGHLPLGEKPIERAKIELLEETGFKGGRFKLIRNIYDYPSKDSHTHYIVRAEGVIPTGEQNLERTEFIEPILIPVKQIKEYIRDGEFQISSAIAALTMAGLT